MHTGAHNDIIKTEAVSLLRQDSLGPTDPVDGHFAGPSGPVLRPKDLDVRKVGGDGSLTLELDAFIVVAALTTDESKEPLESNAPFQIPVLGFPDSHLGDVRHLWDNCKVYTLCSC